MVINIILNELQVYESLKECFCQNIEMYFYGSICIYIYTTSTWWKIMYIYFKLVFYILIAIELGNLEIYVGIIKVIWTFLY